MAELAALDTESVRQDFPILSRPVHGKRLVYLDNAATAQKPRVVIDRLSRYYEEENSNVHRGIHFLSEEATTAYEHARAVTQRFVGAADPDEIVFTRGTTESINLVANSWARRRLKPGDEIVITAMEHHSNIVPWQLVQEETGIALRVVPIDERGELDVEAYERLLGPRTRLVSLVHTSNSLGTVNPVRRMADLAHEHGAQVLIDGAQLAPHGRVDVEELGCDFFAFSGHKVYGPTGIGVLYGRRELLAEMPPYQGGGSMISNVTLEKTTFAEPPAKFEAGTPNIAGAIGLAAALEYVEKLGVERVTAHETALFEKAEARLSEVDGLRRIGTAPERSSILSFVLEGCHPHDLAAVLDLEGVAVRAGHHCTQPVMDFFDIPATVRASIGVYNTEEDFEVLARALEHAKKILG